MSVRRAAAAGAAGGMLARLLFASGGTAEAQDELDQATALFDRSHMTVQLERAKATLSRFSRRLALPVPVLEF
jgi:hypothetical protein